MSAPLARAHTHTHTGGGGGAPLETFSQSHSCLDDPLFGTLQRVRSIVEQAVRNKIPSVEAVRMVRQRVAEAQTPRSKHARREAATTTPRPRQSRNLTQLSVEVSNTLGNTRSRAVSSYAELQQVQQPHAAMAAAAASNSSQPTQPSASTPMASLVCDLNARFQQEQTQTC